MKAEMKQCAYPKCETRIGEYFEAGGPRPEWVLKMRMHGYCMKHGLQEFSGDEEE